MSFRQRLCAQCIQLVRILPGHSTNLFIGSFHPSIHCSANVRKQRRSYHLLLQFHFHPSASSYNSAALDMSLQQQQLDLTRIENALVAPTTLRTQLSLILSPIQQRNPCGRHY